MNNLNNFGSQLKINKREPSLISKEVSEKKIFVDLVTRIEACWIRTNTLYDNYRISILDYEDEYYQIIEDLVFLKYGKWKSEVIMWYLFARVDHIENVMYPFIIPKEKKKAEEVVFVKTPTSLWNLICKLEKIVEKKTKK